MPGEASTGRAVLPEISLPDDHITSRLGVKVESGDGRVVGRLDVRPSMWGTGSRRLVSVQLNRSVNGSRWAWASASTAARRA